MAARSKHKDADRHATCPQIMGTEKTSLIHVTIREQEKVDGAHIETKKLIKLKEASLVGLIHYFSNLMSYYKSVV